MLLIPLSLIPVVTSCIHEFRGLPFLLLPGEQHFNCIFQIKLLIETKPIVCLPWEILHYEISREKLEPEPGFEPRNSGFLARRSAT